VTSDRRYTNADLLADVLVNEGFTHCFFVAGGNIMHLLDSCRTRFTCVPTVHEVAAGIAAEYFNQASDSRRAFALVTAGPGLTNIVTAIAGAWLEHRELVVIGGQVKSSDLMSPGMRQRGIQEIDGVSIVAPITKASVRLEHEIEVPDLMSIIALGATGRPGPVFLEVCLDVQGRPAEQPAIPRSESTLPTTNDPVIEVSASAVAEHDPVELIVEELKRAERPALLLGAGVSRRIAREHRDKLAKCAFPIATTWHGADRYTEADNYIGRLDTWGQRAANLIISQSDLLIAVGARLGLQETGFNHQKFVPNGKVIQVDIDTAELTKGHPNLHAGILGNADDVLQRLLQHELPIRETWLDYSRSIIEHFPLNDSENSTGATFVSPYALYEQLGGVIGEDDVIIPSSSGGSNSVAIQALCNRRNQTVISNCGLASMGYGLSGAIGAALAQPDRTVWLIEGDGGFCQNLQELATVAVNNLNIKMLILANDGYGSIRTTQRNYFEGAYLGCDIHTGLGFPSWKSLAETFGIPFAQMTAKENSAPNWPEGMFGNGPLLVVVPNDPNQTYWPKITSRVTDSGSMESAPLYEMSPPMSDRDREFFARFL